MTLTEMLLIGFTVGLTGAMMPGPMLFATIESSLRAGWIVGPRIVLGHAIIEAATCVLIIYGMSAIMDESAIRAISIAGGASLILFGWLILKDGGKASLDMKGSPIIASPFLAGVITSASNPYFWIWWLSAGSSLIMEGLKTGLIAAGIFVTGHWMADAVWYSLVSGSFSRGRTLMSDRVYRRMLIACGLFLFAFGLWFIIRQFSWNIQE